MKKQIANLLVGALGRRGYTITKNPFHEENEIDLRLLLAERIEKRKGPLSVIQVGANDGIKNDPIHHLIKSRGWSLLAVEPLAPAFERLRENYQKTPNVQCVRCAVANHDGEMTLFTVAPSVDGSNQHDDLASFSIDVLKRHWRHIPNLESRIVQQSVRCLTLKTLMREHHMDDVDMLQIDTEGFDFEILKSAFNIGIYPPIIALEWEHLGQKNMWDCRCLLIEKGYKWLTVKGDIVAAHESQFT